MNQRKYHIPPRQHPGSGRPAHQQAASDYLRQQIDQIYADEGARTPQSHAYHAPTTLEQPAATTPTQVPDEYAQAYNAQTQIQPTYDWQTYHTAWQDYYQQYYQRYYLQQAAQQPQAHATAQQPEAETAPATDPYKALSATLDASPASPRAKKVKAIKSQLLGKVETRAKKAKSSPHFKPLVTAILVGSLFLFLQFNRTLIAQTKYYISPGTLTNEGSAIIINPDTVASVGAESKIIIPKINVDVPVVYDETSYDETKIQKALQRGVVHYGTSAFPGQVGNNVIVGHSSNDLFDSGGYKFAFVLIDRLNNGDIFMLNYEGKRYVYKVYNKAVINPSDFSLINIQTDKPVVTLITCTPPGTALKRLLVQAEQISPEPDANQVAQQPKEETATMPASIPGNSPTLFERIKNIF